MEHLIGSKIVKELHCTSNRYYFIIKNGSNMGTLDCTDREAVQHMIDTKQTGLIPDYLSGLVTRMYDKNNPHLGFTYKLTD